VLFDIPTNNTRKYKYAIAKTNNIARNSI